MTREDIIKMLAVMKVAWPRFYAELKPSEAETAVNLWHTVLQPYPPDVVNAAMQQTIQESPYPPSISDICTRINKMRAALGNGPTPESLWAALSKAASNGFYNAEDEFKALPEICRRFVGGPSALKAMAMMEDETFQSVTRGQFLRLAKGALEREETLAMIPAGIREALTDGFGRLEAGEE